MKKLILTTILSMVTLCFTNAQRKPIQVETSSKKLSKVRAMMNHTDIVRINKDWSLEAEFRSGHGEKIQFFPVEIIDQLTGTKLIALQVDLKLKTGAGASLAAAALGGMGGGSMQSMAMNSALLAASMGNDGVVSAWVDHEEIERMIEFVESEVLPNLDKKYKKKSSEFIFQAKEITMKFLIDESTKRISFILNDGEGSPMSYFYTETRAEKIGDVLPILKRVLSKKLVFE